VYSIRDQFHFRLNFRVAARVLNGVTQLGGDVVAFGKVRPVRESLGGSADSYADVFPVLYTRAYRVAYRFLGSQAAAQDVAQETLARAFAHWRSVGGHAEGWCVTVASRLAIDSIRRRARQQLVEAHDRFVPSAAAAVDERLDLYAALHRLPRKQREVVVLRYLGDLSEAQTAKELGVSLGTVKSHASRGVAALRADLAAAATVTGTRGTA
jgi:RNA polymerase sigma-70 factor (sigma-E family)